MTLQRGGRQARRTKRVHTLVAEAFVGPRPSGHVVRHLDGSRDNNNRDNLTYGTQADNVQDAIKHGTVRRGEAQPRASLSDLQAAMILGLRARIMQADVAEVLGVDLRIINAVMMGARYTHVRPMPPTEAIQAFERLAGRPAATFTPPHLAHTGEAGAHKLTWEAVDQIRADRRSQERIAADFGISQPMVSQIKRGLAWRPETDPRNSPHFQGAEHA